MWLVNKIGLGMTTRRVDKSYLIFNDHFDLPIHQESEIIVPYKDSVELVKTIRDLVIEENFPVNYITEVCAAYGLIALLKSRPIRCSLSEYPHYVI